MIFFLQNHKVFLHHTPEHRTTLITGEFYSKTGRWRLNDITTCFSTCHVIEQPDDSFGMQKIAVDCGDLIVALQNADQGSDNAAQGSEHLQDIIYFKSQHLNSHLTTCKHMSTSVSSKDLAVCRILWVVATLQPASLNLASSSGRDLRSCNCHVVRAVKDHKLVIPTRVHSQAQIHPQSVTMFIILDHPIFHDLSSTNHLRLLHKRWRQNFAPPRAWIDSCPDRWPVLLRTGQLTSLTQPLSTVPSSNSWA